MNFIYLKSKFHPVIILIFFLSTSSMAQVQKDLDKSVPLWVEIDSLNGQATLRWIADPFANNYKISTIEYLNFPVLELLGSVAGDVNEFDLGQFDPGKHYQFHVKKSSSNNPSGGVGMINAGIELKAKHDRGSCLIAIDDTLAGPLQMEIDRLINDISMDGWTVDTFIVMDHMTVGDVKTKILSWYKTGYSLSQAVLLLGDIPVPYSGNTAYDGHGNHAGAWVADTYYGDVNGNWTDSSINNTSPSRPENKNIPGDGKFDQSYLPSKLEIEIGRVDLADLPAFQAGEVELTRKYLDKNHAFRTGSRSVPRRALIENNFQSFDEGFGQNGWRNFLPMFGPDQVRMGNFEEELDTSAFLCSYACGGGSYTSASGIGNTSNLWAAKEIQTVFTLNFGSYFGDWDNQNNFLKASLASGDVLANAWGGRPVWQLFPMSIGAHIGYCARFTQNAAGSVYQQGYGERSAHVTLLGDPTLRLHPVKTASGLHAEHSDGNVYLSWEASPEVTHGYFLYKQEEGGPFILLEEYFSGVDYVDECVIPQKNYTYIVKAIRLEKSASGSYFNTSQGIAVSVMPEDNPFIASYFMDSDEDGYGDHSIDTLACSIPDGYVLNDEDCDDSDSSVYPGAVEIPDNGIDEDCDGKDLLTDLFVIKSQNIIVSPQPANEFINIQNIPEENFIFSISNLSGIEQMSGESGCKLDVSGLMPGYYLLKIYDVKGKFELNKKILIIR